SDRDVEAELVLFRQLEHHDGGPELAHAAQTATGVRAHRNAPGCVGPPRASDPGAFGACDIRNRSRRDPHAAGDEPAQDTLEPGPGGLRPRRDEIRPPDDHDPADRSDRCGGGDQCPPAPNAAKLRMDVCRHVPGLAEPGSHATPAPASVARAATISTYPRPRRVDSPRTSR